MFNLNQVVDCSLDKYINDRMADLVSRAALHRRVLHLSAQSPREHDSAHGHLCNQYNTALVQIQTIPYS